MYRDQITGGGGGGFKPLLRVDTPLTLDMNVQVILCAWLLTHQYIKTTNI